MKLNNVTKIFNPMKKAIFTLFQRQRWLPLRQLALMFILTWGLSSTNHVHAQIITPYSNTKDTLKQVVLTECKGEPNSGSTLFTDDNTKEGNYADNRMRSDTVEICPKGEHSYVRLVVSEFDLDVGDTLFAFDGNLKAVRGNATHTGTGASRGNAANLIGTGTGVGVSRGFGGWLDASCDPIVNPSGCLTFVFQTDGDNAKGKGWEFWVDCSASDVKLGPVTINSKILTPDSAAYANITIPAPEVMGCGNTFPTASDSVRLLVRNQLGGTEIDTILTFSGAANAVSDTFAIGVYSAEYTLLSKPKKKLLVPFSVQAPTLVCNDQIIVPFGSACTIQLTPDDILENPADTIADTMYYNITVMLGEGKNQIIKTTTNFDSAGAVTYPSISVEDLKRANMSVCGATATVMIERIYYQLGGIATIANSGVQNAACQTVISFNDQSQPFISISADADTLVACDTTGLFSLLNPQGIDNCDDDVPVSLSVEMEESDPCNSSLGSPDTTTAIVTFTAVDDCGNVGTATRRIVVIRPSTAQIVQTKDLTLDCRDTSVLGDMPGIQIGLLTNGQFVPSDTIPLSTEEYICGYILTKRDIDIPNTDCGRKLYRYWSVVDWCAPQVGPAVVDTQFVKYTDLTAPTFDNDKDTMRMVSIGAFDCNYDINNLIAPTASDNCSTPIVRLDSIFRIENGLPWPVPRSSFANLAVDSFQVRWIAQDDCHEQLTNDTLMQLVIIKDITRPTAICTDQLNISVGSNDARINAHDLDAGSYDACGILSKEISRDGINFDSTVVFTCEDIHDTVQVFFRVTDVNGNTNTCWLMVHPEDKIRPVCTPFPNGISFANGDTLGTTNDVRVNCNEAKVAAIKDRSNPTAAELAAIGGALPTPLDNCPNAINVELTPIVVSNSFCGQNVYQRRWVAQDEWGFQSIDTCTQLITIENVSDWKITFPEDLTMTCPMSVGATDSVQIQNGSCDRLAVSVESKMFNVVEDACFKVIKTYHIINWCNYRAGDQPTQNYNAQNRPVSGMLTKDSLPNLSYITYTQVIKVEDNDAPFVVVAAELDTCLFGTHDGIAETVGDSSSCGELKTFTAFAGDCVTEVGGVLSHTYKLFLGTEQDVLLGNALEVHRSTGSIVGNNAEMSAFVMSGTYTAEFIFTDNCGNSAVARQAYTFVECKNPTPYLLNGIAIELSQSATIDIWANDFDQGSYDNCTPQDSLEFRIWHISLGFNPPVTTQGVLDSLPTSIVFDCNYLGTQVVRIYVVDQSNNYDYAATFVIIQDNMRACQRGDDIEDMIAGDITNFNGENIENVEVNVAGGSSHTMTTEADGHYQFMLAKNGDYTITPSKNDNPLNGVSTFDLVLISKHILGIETFDSPYKYIAADVNKSGSITAFDMVQLRQLILNVSTEFTNNQSWRFVDENYEFTTNAPMAEPFAESVTIENLTDDLMQTNFIGVKIGDINGNANTNSLVQVEERTAKAIFKLQVEDKLVKAGNFVEVPVTAKDIANIEGYQFTLNFAGLEFVKIEEGVATTDNFNTNLVEKGRLTTSWNGQATKEEVLFKLIFKGEERGYLHDFLQITSDYTKAEAYETTGDLMQVAFDFQTVSTGDDFILNQNAPNPFKEGTIISFNLPNAGFATLKIMDIQGKVLKTIQGNYPKGYHQISLNANELSATGVLHYQLESGNHIANKKMIIIE